MTESRAEHSAEVEMWVNVREGNFFCTFYISRIGPSFAVLQDTIELTSQCKGTIWISVDRVPTSFECQFPDGIAEGTESKTRYILLIDSNPKPVACVTGQLP